MKQAKNSDSPEVTLDSINKRTGRNMPQAIATGVFLVLLIVVCLLIRPDAFMLLIVIFMCLGLWELRVDFATVGVQIPIIALWLCSIATMLAMFYFHAHLAALMVTLLASTVIVTLCASFQGPGGSRLARAVEMKVQGTDRSHIHSGGSRLANVGVSLLTVLYIIFLGSLIVLPLTFGSHPLAHGLMTVFLPAASDIGGLMFGAWIGKHKLSPRISPKKSYEGLAGSMLLCLLLTCGIFAASYPKDSWGRIWWVPLVMGAVVGLTGTFGDLSASLIKRDLGIKDMGHLLKGHGGVLDRVDSILMSAPFITLLLWVTGL